VLDGVVLARLPASHPAEYGLTLELRSTHLTLCCVSTEIWWLCVLFSSAKDIMRKLKRLTAKLIVLGHSRYYSQICEHMNGHFFHNS
jgi:hypothetical protein